MPDRPSRTLASRSLRALVVLAAGTTLSGCYFCSLNGGWEGQMNPFCVEKDALIGSLSLPKTIATHPPGKARPIDPPPSEAITR